MMSLRSLVPLGSAIVLGLAVAACSQSQGRQVVANSGAAEGYPARLALAGLALPADAAPEQPQGGAWQVAADRLSFGVPGQQPLLSMSCQHDASGAAALRIVRVTRAEEGAKALFALIGNGRIARLSLNVIQPGETGQWEGVIPAADARLDVLRGSNSIEATLPGGGTLKLPASGNPGRLLAACRASDTAA